MGSVAAQAVTGLYQAAVAAVGTQAEVHLHRFTGDLPENYVLIASVTRATRKWGDIGGRQRKEVLEIQCHAACWAGDWEPADRYARANRLVSLIDDAILDQMDPTSVGMVFGIPAVASPRALITEIETTTGDTEHGGTDSMIDFTVTVEANIYRTPEGP